MYHGTIERRSGYIEGKWKRVSAAYGILSMLGCSTWQTQNNDDQQFNMIQIESKQTLAANGRYEYE